jgi:ribosome biogenesis GTPase
MLSRRDPFLPERQLAIVANVDVVVVVVSCSEPPLHPRLIDRYLAAIWRGGAEPVIVLNKIDLHEDSESLSKDRVKLDPYRELGIPIVEASTIDAEAGARAATELAELLSGKLAVFVGHSGVGKSSLVNAMLPHAQADTGQTSRSSGKGRHTTTASTLHEGAGVRLIDTPGVRSFGVDFRTPEEIAECFPEFPRGCRYSGCRHVDEAGCVVLEGVRSGQINRPRYLSYRRLLDDAFPSQTHPPDAFVCRHCGIEVARDGAGSQHRNHCPNCLHSLHLDLIPGDRASGCGGLMEPVAVWVRKGQEWAIIHRCRECGHFSSNRIAADDHEMLLMSLAVKPLAQPPFPLEYLAGERSAGTGGKL